MYFVVWDMFCGWSAHSSELHLIAEGESGDFYRLTPAPWGDFVPFATAPRQDYDAHNMFTGKIAANISLKPLQDRRSLLNIASPAARGGW